MSILDFFVIGCYVGGLIGIGAYFSRRQKTTDEYFVANRSIPGWAAGLSLMATIITSVTFIAYPGSAYAGNWSLLVPGFMFFGVLLLLGTVVVPFFRETVRLSVYEYFGKRFGRAVRLYASLAFALGHFSKMGFVFYLLGLTLSSMTGWPIDRIILLTALVTVFYTMLGGIEAIVWSDVLQGFVLWLGIFLSIAYLLALPAAGPLAVLKDGWFHHKMSLGSRSLRFDQPSILVLALYGFFFYLQKYTADQTVVQRYLLAPTDRSALRGMTLGALLCVPVWTAFMLIGSLLWSFYRLTGETLPASVHKADQVFPYFLVHHIPPGLVGLFVAALLGSAIAMLASDLNCLSVVGVQDFYVWLRPASTDRHRLRIGRALVVAGGAAAAAIALRLAHTQGTALSLYYTITAVVAGGLAGLFFLAFLIPQAHRVGALAGIVANLIFTLWATLTLGGKIWDLGRWNFPWHEYMIGVVGHLVLFCTGAAVSLLLPGVPDATDLTFRCWLRQRKHRHAGSNRLLLVTPRKKEGTSA